MAVVHPSYYGKNNLYLTLSVPHATIVVISRLVEKVPLQELLGAIQLSMRLV